MKAANRRFEQLSENEYYCLRQAEAAGLSVPKCFLDTIEEQPLFVIERFDRVLLPEQDRRVDRGIHQVQRLHQEDFCQVLGLLPERKYEKGGERFAKKVRDALYERSSSPVRERRPRELRRASQESHGAPGRRLGVVFASTNVRHRFNGGV